MRYLVLFLGLISWAGAEPIQEKLIEVPPDQCQSPATLTRYLVGTAHTPRQKAERIYLWITHHINYDVAGLKSGKTASSAEMVLKRRCGTCAGYSQLFDSMARSAGLEVKPLHGLARGRSLALPPEAHGWNALRLDGQWRLIDCTWGAGYVNQDIYYRAPIDHYFLTPPEELITTHFPAEAGWQFLPQPLSRSEFDQLTPFLPRRPQGEAMQASPEETPNPSAAKAQPNSRPALSQPRLLRSYYTRGVTLYRPQAGSLNAGKHEFHLQVPGARGVEVQTGTDAFSLVANKNEVFRGLVPLTSGRIRVLASFDESGRLEPLLEYEVR